jgi:hypothetical protein
MGCHVGSGEDIEAADGVTYLGRGPESPTEDHHESDHDDHNRDHDGPDVGYVQCGKQESTTDQDHEGGHHPLSRVGNQGNEPGSDDHRRPPIGDDVPGVEDVAGIEQPESSKRHDQSAKEDSAPVHAPSTSDCQTQTTDDHYPRADADPGGQEAIG